MSYEEIFATYDEHLQENQEIYLERIQFLNRISNELIKGVVKVKKSSSNLTSVALGSGLVFDEDALYYYILTNNHVVYDPDIEGSSYTVYDFQNNIYNATYMVGDNDFDLAILRVRKKSYIKLNIFVLANQIMEVNSHITTMGYPESQLNAINTGMLLDYGPVTIDVPSTVINIDFHVMIADLPVKSGSSGSAAINNNYELVGIIFAGNFTGGSNIADYAFLIPIDKVKEFLTLHHMKFAEVRP
jgi:S1-C subfamily serine protease